ncbi:PREDICTED: uncharacterized protein LOC109463310 [Branchiostoma belcheri]|uniref:Uncharacterized protein LOC109463310 n=1 Tax=Branchiostoma belcheri TaxID=7741 RepID=A0A6P4XGG8_BRABE|nr:PREDICTED: uncharacterized protein LOC109463310 [Branchiostoma belcheri]
MANVTLVNLALENKIMERNQVQEHRLLVDGLQMAEDDLYFSDEEEEDIYMEKTPRNNHTTVFPLTLQWVCRFRASVDDDCGPDLILRKFLTSLSDCENRVNPYDTFAACDTTGLNEHQLLNDLNNDSWVCLSRSKVGTIYESDGEEWTDEETGQTESETPHNKLVTCDVAMAEEIHQLHALDTGVYLPRIEVGTIYESDSEEWTTDEETDVHSIEERLAVCTSSVPLPQVQSHCAAEEGFQIMDPTEIDQQSDFAREGMIQILDPFEIDQQSDFATEMVQLLDPMESYCNTEVIQLLDPMESDPDQHSYCGTEEDLEFHLLDPVEVPVLYVWGEGIFVPKAVTTKRLSRYELHYGPTHCARSPSRPMIGARGDSRERSLVNSDDPELPSLPNLAPECHQVKATAARTTRGSGVKTAAPKTHCCSFHRDPIGNLPSPGCPWWLLLMGLPIFFTVTVTVVRKLGKPVEKSQQGQSHWQPLAQQELVITSKHSRCKICSLLPEVALLCDICGCPNCYAPISVNPNRMSLIPLLNRTTWWASHW